MSTQSVVAAGPVYKVLYSFLWYLYNVLEILSQIYDSIRTRIVNISHEISAPTRKNVISPSKLPRHVTVLLGPEEPSYKDLTNLILWCLASGISYISFYDYKGTLKKNEDKLFSLVQQKKLSNDHVIWHNNPDIAPKNGFVGRKIHVKVLCADDGKLSEVELVKKMALSCETDFSVENVDKWHRKQYEFPDPDLGITCGTTFSLYGYPPWQVRVTEFLNVKSHYDITFDVYNNLLVRYSKCEQRFGK